jgi:acetone carboxylase gamma subunit
MKFIGKYKVGCQCTYCIGTNARNRKVQRSIKRGGKQQELKEIKKALKKEED